MSDLQKDPAMSHTPVADTFARELQGLASAARFGQDELDVVYAMAFQALTVAQHAAALRYFAFLTLYAPANADYLAGLALAQQHLQQHEAAIATNTLLELAHPGTAAAAAAGLRVAECEMALQQPARARQTLRLVATAYARTPGAAASCQRAGALAELLPQAEAA